jgi:hypothetical protein
MHAAKLIPLTEKLASRVIGRQWPIERSAKLRS